MLDVDRTEGQGGGAGTAHDGLLYVTYDIFEPVTRAYLASVLRMTRTSESFELVVSHRDDSSFGGSQLQPFAGVADGTLYLMGSALTADSSGTVAIFHELTNGGAGPNHLSKSALAWPTAGQQLGTSGRWGVNGHRIDTNGYAAIDRSQGPRRGWLYLVSNRNPNPGDPGSDQGDIFVSYSPDGAGTWYFNTLPTEPGKTQYFPMLDVDADGGLHVAYYQNEAGTEHAGVLNAAAASLYYAVSDDGGETWSVPVRLNADENALRFPDPPPDRSQGRYYLIGDYAQLRVVGGRSSRKAYVLWTGFDDNRTGAAVGQAKARVLCTTIACIDVPAPVADKISRALQKAKELRGLAAAATPHRAKRLARKGRKGLRKATRLTTKVARRGNISDACRAQLEGRLEDAERLMASP
jgi:hypothetical protein